MALLLKIFALYLITISIMRLRGKSTIIQMEPYGLVAIIIVGKVVSEPSISIKFSLTVYTLKILVIRILKNSRFKRKRNYLCLR